MFDSVSRHVKTTNQGDVNYASSSSSPKHQKFTCRWTQSHLVSDTVITGDIPSSRSKHATCLYDDYVYLYGGRYGSVGYRDLWRYSIAQGQWEVIHGTGEQPSLLQSHTLVANEDKLYVFGGNFSINPETPLWIFHLGTHHWQKYAVSSEVMTPCSRRAHTAVVSHGAMHIYGGYVDLKGSNSELWTFDFATEGWHLGYCAEDDKPGPSARHGHSAVVYGGAMWVFGGMMNLETRNDLWCWNFDTRLWKRVKGQRGVPELYGHSACTVADSMLVFGGSLQGEQQNIVWRFHFGTCTWQSVQCDGVAPSPCDHHTAVIFRHRVPPPADRSHSAPHVGRDRSTLLSPNTCQLRPNSSPASVACTRGNVPFQNKVEPRGEPSSPCKVEMSPSSVARRVRTKNPPHDASQVSCPLCTPTGGLTMYRMRKSWSVDFCTWNGVRVGKVSDTRPLIRRGKFDNSLSEDISLSSFGGSMNPVYEHSPPYALNNNFLCRISDQEEEIPLKMLRQNSVTLMPTKCNFHDSGRSRLIASTWLCLGENRNNMRRSKRNNHYRSSSLESLLSRFESAEIGGADNRIACRSVQKNDLFVEDIEETSFNGSSDVHDKMVVSQKSADCEYNSYSAWPKKQELVNYRTALSNHAMTYDISDEAKSLTVRNDSGGFTVSVGNSPVRRASYDEPTMAWLQTLEESHNDSVTAKVNSSEQNGDSKVTYDSHSETVSMKLVPPRLTVTPENVRRLAAISDDTKTPPSTNTAIYHLFVFGGRVDETQNLLSTPLSVSKLQISTSHIQ